jgi:uncharacterized protein (DUF1684 family)
MMNTTIVIMDDWTALYVDGKLAYQNHTISAEKALEFLGIEYSKIDLMDNREIAECLPETIEELKDMIKKNKT